MAKTRSRKHEQQPLRFDEKLVMNQWMLSLFEVSNFDKLAEHLKSLEVQSKLRDLAFLLRDLLLPGEQVAAVCREMDFPFRQRIYTPMVTVWMFVTQVLSADHSCQQAVARLNGWRTAQGLPRCASETTSYCKARRRLPEALFERLLGLDRRAVP